MSSLLGPGSIIRAMTGSIISLKMHLIEQNIFAYHPQMLINIGYIISFPHETQITVKPDTLQSAVAVTTGLHKIIYY